MEQTVTEILSKLSNVPNREEMIEAAFRLLIVEPHFDPQTPSWHRKLEGALYEMARGDLDEARSFFKDLTALSFALAGKQQTKVPV